MWAMAAVLGPALAVAGCGGGDDAGGGSKSPESRRPMPSCGSYQVPLGELPVADQAIRDCFLSAFGAGREAEVTITATSFEGDPIVTIYRVLGPNDLELFVDASADKFAGDLKTYRQRCTSVVEDGPTLAAGGCSPATPTG